MPRVVIDLFGGADFHNFSRIHHGDTVRRARHHAQIVRDENCRGVKLLLKPAQKVQNLRLNGHVQRRRRLVGKQNLCPRGKRDGKHRTLAHAAGEVVRIELHARVWAVDADQLHQLQHTRAQRIAGNLRLVDQNRFGNLRADRHAGIERSHGVLKDHGKQPAAQLLQLLFRVRRDVRAVDQDFSLDAGIIGQQAHDCLAQRAFAAAGFSDDGKHLAGL